MTKALIPDATVFDRLDTFAQASSHYQAGELPQAEFLLRQLLSADANHAPAIHLLGVMAYQGGEATVALGHFQRAAALDPGNAVMQNSLGAAYQALGQHGEAFACYHRALELRPGDPAALNNLGISLMGQGLTDDAVAVFRQALAADPTDAAGLCNLAAALAARRELDESIALYRQALRQCPDLVQAHNNLGNALKAKGQLEEAEACYRRALQLWPRFTQAHQNLGKLFLASGRPGQAVRAFQEALQSAPADALVIKDLASALLMLNRTDEAIAHCRHALRLRPNDPEIWNDLGNACYARGDLDDALRHYGQSIGLAPDWSMPHYNLGLALQGQGRLAEARVSFQKALELKPDDHVAHSTYAGSLYYDPEMTAAQILAEHQRWAERHAHFAGEPRAHDNYPDPERRLRVGYVSPDFRSHATASFIEPILANHDPELVDCFCYAEVSVPDATTARLRGLACHWRHTVGLSDDDFATLIRRDSIDILVDLAGHTAGNRLMTFARKPAPVQISYLGYPGTTGLRAIDYRLVDAVTDPPDEPSHSSEVLARLPGSFCCYAPPTQAPLRTSLPTERTRVITFGSLHKLEKLNNRVVDLWCQILKEVPTARLLLCRHILHGGTAAYWLEQFRQRGIDPARVVLRRVEPVDSAHLAVYGDIDIALDPFPWNGHTTACEALWMGVPVVALRGTRHSSRMVASVLTSLGLTDLIADTAEEYSHVAMALAADQSRRAELREQLRKRMTASRLLDGKAFTRDLEVAYRDLWRQWCEWQPREVTMTLDQEEPAALPARPCLVSGAAERNGSNIDGSTTKVLLIAATRKDRHSFERYSYLGRSLKRLGHDPGVKACMAYENKQALPTVFNDRIVESNRDRIAVFTHDDVFIDDFWLAVRLEEAFLNFDIVGVAGNIRRLAKQPSWAFIQDTPVFQCDAPENLSGAVRHLAGTDERVSAFGMAGVECVLLDGVFLAARIATLLDHNLRFDEQFAFHFYDMDFCRAAVQAGLRLGTWPIAITHASGGAFGSNEWKRCRDLYFKKWAE
jgi:predicted O-linked N-acetylglucosamine transferase (SPINDLY family)